MSVQGGRSRWRRALASGGSAGALGLLLLVSCGGRTSALDSDVYGGEGDGQAGTSGSSGQPGVAGTPGVGASAPVGGSGPGISPSAAACRAYCPGYGTQCKQRLMGQDCEAACLAEVDGFGARCQSLGLEALRCLTPFFTPNGANCDAAVNAALGSCGSVVAKFQACKQAQAPSVPPMPTKPADVTSCESMGFSDSTLCLESYDCSAGTYTVICSFSPMSPTAECSCTRPSGESLGKTLPNDGKACFRAAATLCP